jgi:hypothetical protein
MDEITCTCAISVLLRNIWPRSLKLGDGGGGSDSLELSWRARPKDYRHSPLIGSNNNKKTEGLGAMDTIGKWGRQNWIRSSSAIQS